MRSYGLELAGQLSFNGTLKGALSSPDLNGRVSLGSVLVNGNDLGSLSASIVMTPAELRIADGRLTEKDGGGMQFTLNAPRTGENNTTFTATLDRVNARTLTGHAAIGQSDARATWRHSGGRFGSDTNHRNTRRDERQRGVTFRSGPPGRRTSGKPGRPRHLQRFQRQD